MKKESAQFQKFVDQEQWMCPFSCPHDSVGNTEIEMKQMRKVKAKTLPSLSGGTVSF